MINKYVVERWQRKRSRQFVRYEEKRIMSCGKMSMALQSRVLCQYLFPMLLSKARVTCLIWAASGAMLISMGCSKLTHIPHLSSMERLVWKVQKQESWPHISLAVQCCG